jgi:filamentous hemagglutinin family protein
MRRNPACRVVSAVALIGAIIYASAPHAQIIHDTSLGGPRTDVGKGPNLLIDPALGKIQGANLFYSFEQFNVLQKQTATFEGPSNGAPISNVVSRVTGGSSSQIFGTIAFDPQIHGANFFLLNPNGVIVGPGATFDVGGSVHLTTADSLKFTDDKRFLARPAPDEVLSAADPFSFGFLGTSSTVSKVEINGNISRVTLKVAEQKTLSLIGGEVAITGATLAAPGGRVQIASLSSGEAMLDGSVTPSSRLGPITITGSTIGATGLDGLGSGTVIIRGGQLLVDASQIYAHTPGDVAGPRLIDIQVAGDVCLTNGAVISSATSVADRGGDIRITADKLRLDNQSLVETNASSEGDGGCVIATVGGLTVVGGSSIGTTGFATGRGGNITVKADAIKISGSSQIFSNAWADGNGGKVSLAPRLSTLELVLDNTGGISSATLFGAGSGGDIQVNATSVRLLGGATISSLTSTVAPGGSIALTANSVTISGGDSSTGVQSGIFSGSFGAAETGTPGKISVTAGNFTLTQGGTIQSGGTFAPEAGDIEITATNSLVISSGGTISSAAFDQPGGQVSLVARTAIMDGGFVNTSTLGAGPAGNVVIDVGTLTMRSGATISAKSTGTGLAGSITIRAGTLQSQNSFVTTEAAQADGGDIDILVGSLLHLSGSEITTSVHSSVGKGGNITIDPQFVVLNNSQIRADAFGGPGGNITIVTDAFLSSGSIISASSALSAPGTIDVQAQTSDVSGSVARLPESVLQAVALLPASCELRMAGGSASSLIVAGSDGVPVDPGGPLPAAGLLGQAWLLAAQETPPARTALASNAARISDAMSARLAALPPCTR